MEIAFTPSAWRDWRKLPTAVQRRLQGRLLVFAEDPLQYAIKLTEPAIGQYRFRVGDYRIVFDIQEGKIVVHAVGDRKNIYR